MLWLGSPRPSVPSSAAPVPDPEALRQAALQASWRRDRRVARRRLWFRWTLWGLQTYAWQIAAALAVLLVLVVWFWPASQPESTPSNSAPAASTAPDKTPVPAPAVAAVPFPASSGATQPVPANRDAFTALPLKLERRWPSAPRPDPSAAVARPAPPTTRPTPAPADVPAPTLKPDNWLHSKEP